MTDETNSLAHPAPEQVAEASGREGPDRKDVIRRYIEKNTRRGRNGCYIANLDTFMSGFPMFASPSAQADRAEAQDAAVGGLAETVRPFLPLWGPEGCKSPQTGVRGVPDASNADPRLSVHEYQGHDGNLTLSMMIGERDGAGLWREMNFTPDQCVQIIASILSKAAVEEASRPLLGALSASVIRSLQAELADQKQLNRALSKTALARANDLVDEAIRAERAEAERDALREALEPFALMSTEGIVKSEAGFVTVTTCAEYFHRAALAMQGEGS